MPELPEVETVRRFLQSNITDKQITDIQILNDKSFFGDPHLILNSTISGFNRVGKQLTIFLDNHLALLFHLKMTGQLVFTPSFSKRGRGEISVLGHPTPNLPAEALAKVGKSTRVIFTFSDNSTLYFNDQRKFGWIRIVTQPELVEGQKNLGPDILSPDFVLEYFTKTLSKSSRPIKLVLLDQTKFAGIGNIYANDALWEAKIHPLTPSNKIPKSKILTLYDSVIDIIQESITHGGSTAKDNKYILPDGSFGGHQFHFRVYQREGEPCSRCGTPIERLKLAGRSAFFCSKCQNI